MKIKDLPRVDRPREKLEKYGPEKLSNSEILAIILGTGSKNVNAVELSNKILKKFGSKGIIKANINDLKNSFGLGMAKSAQIIACFELGRRFLQNKKSRIYFSPRDIWIEMKDIRDNKKEHFVVFFLDARNQEIKREIVSVGSLNANLAHPREVFEPAIRSLAAQIILVHNHPSGNTDPSEDDLAITKRLIEAGKILGIEVVDHIIVTKNDFLSLKQKKIID